MFGTSTVWILVLEALRGMFGTSTVWIWVLVGLKGMFGVFIGFALIAAPQNVILGGFKKCAGTPKYYTTIIVSIVCYKLDINLWLHSYYTDYLICK